MMLTVIILTRDEALHIARAVNSVRPFADRIVVVDSGSTDQTCQIAERLGAEILHRPWRNYADQFNWAVEQVSGRSDWIMRLDADEIVSPALCAEIKQRLPALTPEIAGVFVPRFMNFLGGPVLRGGMFPVQMLRLFRTGCGRCEARWMDEHIKVRGETVRFKGHILDDNLKPLGWWTDKHNSYAAREVVDLLNQQHGFLQQDTISGAGTEAGRKRWVKENLYARFPLGARAVVYFLWRFIFRLGFLDSPQGRSFHLLQGLWYRYLVDMKLREVRAYMRMHSADPPKAILAVLGIDVHK
ncbi:glycosyltransferase family 2 protein [Ruegeria sp.]|uniref:glycosyltransferase family 2 protein n=1 Tax=Ruegeria sp. TaxID=1879320 RepID=UPI003C7BA161